MKKSVRIVSTAMAAMMAASMLTVGAVSASAAKLKKPASVKAVNTSAGVKLTWKAAKGAKKYTIYRGKKALKSVKKLTFTDKTAKAGKKYTYTVKSVNGKKTASAKKVSVYRLKAPTSLKLSATYEGLKLSWKKASGASKYKVYRKATGGKYALVKTVGDKKSFTDKTVENGTKYTYKLKAYKAGSTSAASAKVTKTYMAVVTNIKADVKVEGNVSKVTLTWDKNDAASKYRITRLNLKNEMEFVKETTDTTFTDEYTNDNPKVIAYSVVAIKGSSSYKNGMAIGHFPQNCHFTDKDGNVNVNLKLKNGETYVEGSSILVPLMFVSTEMPDLLPTIEVTEGSDVVTTDMGTITALKAGTAKIKISFGEECKALLLDYLEMIPNGNFKNKLETGVVYVNVTVEE